MSIARWSFPTLIRFGTGAIRELPAILAERRLKRPLVVTDRGLVGLPPYTQLFDVLSDAGISAAVYSEFSPNPTAPEVAGGAAAFRDHGCDCIVGIGGGSALDGAKAVQLMAHHPGSIEQYDDRVGGYDRIGGFPLPPHFAVPTTAGTGSEVGRSTVIVNLDTHEKMVIFHPALMPAIAVVDPLLMATLPPALTAATGMDALTHNVEAYLSLGFHPLADGVALHGVRLCAGYLQRAVEHGDDGAARAAMAAASLMGATAFQKGLGVTHSLAHPLSTLADMHHGLANGILIPYAMAYNAEAVPEKFVELANAIGRPQADAARSAKAFVDWLVELKKSIRIPTTLTDAGVPRDKLDALAEQAFRDGCHASNPRPVTAEDIRSLYAAAFDGR